MSALPVEGKVLVWARANELSSNMAPSTDAIRAVRLELCIVISLPNGTMLKRRRRFMPNDDGRNRFLVVLLSEEPSQGSAVLKPKRKLARAMRLSRKVFPLRGRPGQDL